MDMKLQDKMKTTIYLAGDSTMQSYSEEQRPQYGWGEFLLQTMEPQAQIRISHREDCPFGQERLYEGAELIVDNCAMAGRSSKTFREEGRLRDIAEHIRPGDYLFIQFGHNDAGKGKPERYVQLQDFKGSLEYYVKAAQEHGAVPVLISSIVLLPCPENEQGEAGEIAAALPLYGAEMREYAAHLNIPYIDMQKLTGECCSSLLEAAASFYKSDKVHLLEDGARTYAGLLREQAAELIHGNRDSDRLLSHS